MRYIWTPARLRMLVHLREVEGMTWPHIAIAMGLSYQRLQKKYREVKTMTVAPAQ